MHIFARITKVDAATRKVYGRAVEESLDHANEVFDYAGSKPYFKSWSENFAKATDGKSVGNVRAMHGKTAAGKLSELIFNDSEKAIDVCAVVVDDNEWQKCQEGVYTGFSIGGRYVGAKVDDPVHKGAKRYIANPTEVSLVDAPCVPGAVFTMVKADGVAEQQEFSKALQQADGIALQTTLLDTELNKGVYTVGWMCDIYSQLKSLASDAAFDALVDGSSTDVPEALKTALAALGAALRSTVADATTELELSAPAPMAKAVVGQAHKDKMQAIHDHAAAMGAECPSGDAGKALGGDLAKVTAIGEENQVLKGQVTTLTEEGAAINKALGCADGETALQAIEKLQASVQTAEELAKEVPALVEKAKKYDALPAPGKGAIRVVAVSKDNDGTGEAENAVAAVTKADGKVDEVATLIKQAHKNGPQQAER